jgi:hypothetical protein
MSLQGGVACHADVQDFSIGVPNHREGIERLEQNRLNAEKIPGPLFDARSFRNFRQPGEGPREERKRIYLAAVPADTLKPNLADSAWIRF